MSAYRWIVLTLAFAIPVRSPAQSIEPLVDLPQTTSSPALSPDGTTIAFLWSQQDNGGIFTRPIAGGEPIPFAMSDDIDGLPVDPRWSPDGKQIAFIRLYCRDCSSRLFVKGIRDGTERALGEVCSVPPSWTPDGHFIVTAEPVSSFDDCRIALIPADGSRREVIAPRGDLASVSPDGKHLAYSDGNKLMLANLTARFRSGAPITAATEPHAVSSIAWLPDGSTLVYQVWGWQGYSKLLTLGDLARTRLLEAARNVEIQQVLPDGERLAPRW